MLNEAEGGGGGGGGTGVVVVLPPPLVPAPGVPKGPCCINHPETAFIALLFLTLLIILNVARHKC